MAAKKVQLKDKSGNKAYPVTSSACVGMSDGSGNLDNRINEIVRESDSGQFGYAKDCFINGSTGKVETFKGLCILSIPYKSGDVIEVVGAIDPDGAGGVNSRYNFYTGDTYIGGGDTLDDIPEGTDTIKINSNYVSRNGVECVMINGKAYNIRSIVYQLDKRVTANTEAITANTEAITANTEAIVDDGYPVFDKRTSYPKGYAVLYGDRVYRFIEDHAAGGWTGEDAEAYPLAERWRDYCENDYYHPLTFVVKDDGDLVYFRNVAYIEFPYTDGDTVEIFKAHTSGAYNRYNFFKGKEFLGTANDETWNMDLIPEECDRIKVNCMIGNPAIVIVNGVGINRLSEAYRLGLNIEELNDNVKTINGQLDIINRDFYNVYKSLITDYGTDKCIAGNDGNVIISRNKLSYNVKTDNNTKGQFVAKTTNIDSSLLTVGRRIAYFVDVDIVKFPQSQTTYTFGAISTDIGRKSVNVMQGQRLRSVFKVTLTDGNAKANKCGLFFFVSASAVLNNDWEYDYHSFGIIDCGVDDSNPLYNLSGDEILALLNDGTYAINNNVFVPNTNAIPGLKNINGTFVFKDEDDETIATLDKTGLKTSDVKSLDGKSLYMEAKLKGKEFFTVGDSLCSEGSWQPKFAELTGGIFDKEYNKDNISVGGTRSLGASIYSGQNRLKKLIEEKSPEIIILENINDYTTDVDDTDYSYMISEIRVSETTYENISDARTAKESEIGNIPLGERSVGHALRIGYKSEQGKKIIISGVATNSRTAIVRVGATRTNIDIIDGDTAVDVISKIYEVYWPGYEKFTDNATFVAFVNSDGGAADVGYFMLSGNGINVQEDTYESTSYVNFYYIGQNTNDGTFRDVSNWKETLPISAVYKGMFEYIFSKLPNCRVMWFIPTRMIIQWEEDGNGWDANLWLEKGVRVNMNYYKNTYKNKVDYDVFRKFQKDVAQLYGVEVYDINDDCNINPYNHKTFYPNYNVHPLQAGYDRFAETFAKILKY